MVLLTAEFYRKMYAFREVERSRGGLVWLLRTSIYISEIQNRNYISWYMTFPYNPVSKKCSLNSCNTIILSTHLNFIEHFPAKGLKNSLVSLACYKSFPLTNPILGCENSILFKWWSAAQNKYFPFFYNFTFYILFLNRFVPISV